MSGVAGPVGLNGESPAKVEGSGVVREEVVVLEHEGNQHVGGDESIHEHEENDQHFGVEDSIGGHDPHVNVSEEGLEENIEGGDLRAVDFREGEAEDNGEDVEEGDLEEEEGKDLGYYVGEDDEELREIRDDAETEEEIKVVGKKSKA